jgi:hypothetical protein
MKFTSRAWIVSAYFRQRFFQSLSLVISNKNTPFFVCPAKAHKSNRMAKEPHIGHLIKMELRNQGRSITWLAKQLNFSRQNIYKILNRNWIYTDLLLKICDLLDYDFFKAYSDYINDKK